MRTFSITSYNCLWGLTPDHTPFALDEVAVGFDTDLVALQEVWQPAEGDDSLRRAAAGAGYELIEVPLSGSSLVDGPHITADPSEIHGTWGVALLSRLPITTIRVVDLGRLVERWDVAERHAIIAEVDVDGQAVSVAALHLSFIVPNAAAQLRRLSGYLPTHLPSVVAGDCNLWGPLAAGIVHRHRRAVRGRTWPAHRPHSQLDHILVSPELEVVRSEVLAPAGSDHLPVQAVLSL